MLPRNSQVTANLDLILKAKSKQKSCIMSGGIRRGKRTIQSVPGMFPLLTAVHKRHSFGEKTSWPWTYADRRGV